MGLTACITDVWTGATIIYDRHKWYRKLDDFKLAARVNRDLYADQAFKCSTCAVEIAVFHQDVLLAGHVPTHKLRREAAARIKAIPGIRHFYDELTITHGVSDPVLDTWITTKVRSEILADASIDPNQFKIVTADRVVYLMGDVLPDQAKKVIHFAREWVEVRRVVTLFQYYHLSTSAQK